VSPFDRIKARITAKGECWIWPGADSGNGYGRISVRGRTKATHIVVYEQLKGPIPKGMVLDHTCLNRLCCNPNHLDPKTPLSNTLIGNGPTAHNARKKECKRGHPLEGENLIKRVRNGRVHRECRECKNMRRQKEAGQHGKQSKT